MKHLVFGSLSLLVLSVATANVAQAQTTAINSTTINLRAKYINQIAPVDLVEQAYRGALKNQGIPSYGTFITEYRAGHITGKNLVESAIQANMLPSSALDDQGYINAVSNGMHWTISTIK